MSDDEARAIAGEAVRRGMYPSAGAAAMGKLRHALEQAALLADEPRSAGGQAMNPGEWEHRFWCGACGRGGVTPYPAGRDEHGCPWCGGPLTWGRADDDAAGKARQARERARDLAGVVPEQVTLGGYFYRVESGGTAVTIGFATFAELTEYLATLDPPAADTPTTREVRT